MPKDLKGVFSSDGRYFLDTGYKNISSGNTEEALRRILNQINDIKAGNFSLSCRPSYCVATHEQKVELADFYNQKNSHNSLFRKEEWICKICKTKSFSHVGKIVDYQVPLKHKAKGECEGMGKIDLLSLNGDEAYLLELKVKESTESPLRAIMEIYTYWRQLGGNDSAAFLSKSKAKGASTLKKGIVIYENNARSSIYYKLQAKAKEYQMLMKELEVECFIAVPDAQTDCDNDLILDLRRWN